MNSEASVDIYLWYFQVKNFQTGVTSYWAFRILSNINNLDFNFQYLYTVHLIFKNLNLHPIEQHLVGCVVNHENKSKRCNCVFEQSSHNG